MCRIQLQLDVPEAELLDASDDVQRLIDGEGEFCPPLRDLLAALDDAITVAFVEEAAARSRATA